LGEPPPARAARETPAAPAGAADGDVWVNTRSGKYRKSGSRYYGKTKEGEFMPEMDALDRGSAIVKLHEIAWCRNNRLLKTL